MPSDPLSTAPAILVHVLFMDIVRSTKYFTDEQRGMVEMLQTKVRATTEYQKASGKHELITCPSGDGMALVFLSEVEAPLRCAIELARSLGRDSGFALRMGIHSGPVFVLEDIAGQTNASGAGINRAQRIMDCGDDNHILLSDASADVLRQMRHWASLLHDMGDCKAKDAWYHVWSYYDSDIGNRNVPRKAKQVVSRRRRWIGAGVLAAICLALIVGWLLFEKNGTGGSRADQGVRPTSERSITYSVLVKPPNGPARAYAKEMLLPAHYGIKLRFQSDQAGFLYLINEGPQAAQERSWHWLFPYPAFRDGSAAIGSPDIVTLPAENDKYYELDQKSGPETIFVVWSDRKLPELESIKQAVFAGGAEGKLGGEQVRAVEAFLQAHKTPVDSKQSESGTTLHTRNSYLTQTIVLEHL